MVLIEPGRAGGRSRVMNALKAKMVLFNAAAGLVAVSALFAAARVFLAPSSASPCSERYSNSMKFQLDRDGSILNTSDIQARIGGSDVGLENVDIVKPKDPRIPAALRVNLRNGANVTSATASAGMSFPWEPRAVRNETAACLSYEAFLHGDLEFHGGGTLPGLKGSDKSQSTGDGFAANLAWRSEGQPGATVTVTESGETQRLRVDHDHVTLPRGRWFKIDEEVVLNTPGQDDGMLRVWIDGALAFERAGVGYRNKSDVTISGVAADVHYGRDETATAPIDTKIWVSPFEMSWR
jgi:hypothetical protein